MQRFGAIFQVLLAKRSVASVAPQNSVKDKKKKMNKFSSKSVLSSVEQRPSGRGAFALVVLGGLIDPLRHQWSLQH